MAGPSRPAPWASSDRSSKLDSVIIHIVLLYWVVGRWAQGLIGF